jgi:hypothetical protein
MNNHYANKRTFLLDRKISISIQDFEKLHTDICT